MYLSALGLASLSTLLPWASAAPAATCSTGQDWRPCPPAVEERVLDFEVNFASGLAFPDFEVPPTAIFDVHAGLGARVGQDKRWLVSGIVGLSDVYLRHRPGDSPDLITLDVGFRAAYIIYGDRVDWRLGLRTQLGMGLIFPVFTPSAYLDINVVLPARRQRSFALGLVAGGHALMHYPTAVVMASLGYVRQRRR